MGKNSKIPWCHHTWNAWTGCEKVSAECKNCYAVTAPPTRIARSKGLELWGAKAHRQVASEKMWADPARWNHLAASRGVRERVFVNSLSDFFEDYSGPSVEAVRAARERAFGVMRNCGQLDFLLLTKRPENILAMVPQAWLSGGWPQNVWVGTTAGTRETAAARIPLLKKVPAPVKFVSAEPLLEDVPWENYCEGEGPCSISWLIVGGESGPGARPFDIAWARRAMKVCAEQRVPFFMKQLGAVFTDSSPLPVDPDATAVMQEILDGFNQSLRARALGHITDRKGEDPAEWPADLRVRQIPRYS